MSEVLFRSSDITITRSVAKFGNATYPIANIGSVVIEAEAGFFGTIMVLAAFVLGGITWASSSFLAGLVVFGVLVIIAQFMPKKRKLTLKTSSGDVTALTSGNTKLVEDVRSAIESAFAR